MTFARIEMLFLIWAAPLVALAFAYGMRRRRKALSRYASAGGLSVITPAVATGRRWTKAGLLLAALVFTALALSGPRYGFHWRKIERRGVDLLIALDCSRSMLAQDLQPTRLDRAKREVLDLLAMLEGDRVGLVAFSGTAFLQCPLTLDYTAFHLFLDVLSPDYLPVGGSDITGALRVARNGFDPTSAAEKAVILITDGEDTGRGDPLEAAGELEKAGITLFCIGVGGEAGAPVPEAGGGFKKDRSGQIVMTRLDEETLKKMAIMTGGTYVRSVAGDMDLDLIYGEEIRGKMEAVTLAGGRKQVWEDRFQWFLGLAILCMVAELFIRPLRRTAAGRASFMAGIFLLACLGLPAPTPALAGPLEEGVAAYDRGEYESALKLFIDAQLDDPDRPDILYNIGNAYYKLGEYAAALTHYQQALDQNPVDLAGNARYNMGNAHFRNQDYEAALAAYEAALKIDPDDREAKENLRFVRKVMEQQRKPSSGTEENDRREETEKDRKAENQPRGSGDDPDPQQDHPQDASEEDARPSPEFGDRMTENNQNRPKTEEEAQEPAPGEAPSAAVSDAPLDEAARKGAERALNRLKDQPGKALMIPGDGQGRQGVEKDW